jgi:hypothetical protein
MFVVGVDERSVDVEEDGLEVHAPDQSKTLTGTPRRAGVPRRLMWQRPALPLSRQNQAAAPDAAASAGAGRRRATAFCDVHRVAGREAA